MSNSEKSPSSFFEESKLKDEVSELLQKYSEDVVILQDKDDLSSPAQIILGGKLRSTRPGHYLDVLLTNCVYEDDGEVTTIAIGKTEYMISRDGVICGDEPEFNLSIDDLMKLRFWAREALWSRQQTELLSGKYQEGL